MASQELELIAKVIDVGDLQKVLDEGVRLEDFKTEDGRMVLKYLLKFWRNKRTAGNVPTREMVEKRFPTVDLPRENRLNLDAVLAEFKDHHVRAELKVLSDHIVDNINKPDQLLVDIQNTVGDLARTRRVTQDLILSQSISSAIDRYESHRDQDGYQGIPYPWDVLNKETQGMQTSEFILFYGRPKSLKTWVLLKIATHAYDFSSRRVLVYTREMTPEQMIDRSICLLIGAPYRAYKQGTLAEIPVPEGGTMEERFYATAETMSQDEDTCALETGFRKTLIITSDRTDPRGGGVLGLRKKVEDHKPDLVCVDAMYLMRNDRKNTRSVKWDDQSAITQDVKEIALDFKIPVIGTTQANRPSEEARGKSMANIAFADSYGMDCDLAVEINKKSTRNPEVNELALAITGAREINMTGFAIHGNAASDFGVMMRKVISETGVVQVDGDGNPMLEPVVFYEIEDIKNFFKEQDNERKRNGSERMRSEPSRDMKDWAAGLMNKGKRHG
jgi:hypothetical protein